MSRNDLKPLFDLGAVVLTRAASDVLNGTQVYAALRLHQSGNWGEIPESHRLENELGLREGFRLMSVYKADDGLVFWVITEADRSVTTILLPDDY